MGIMGIMEIIKISNENNILKQPTIDIIDFNDELFELINTMASTLIKAGTHAVGLAAPQVGINKNIFIGMFEGLKAYINPKICQIDKRKKIELESCLSLTKSYMITRYTNIYLKCDMTYIPFKGIIEKDTKKKYFGIEARIIQHEVDHLHGVLIGDV